MKYLWIVMVMALLVGAPAVVGAGEAREEGVAAAGGKGTAAAGVRWYTFEEGFSRGQREGKKIFLNFYADWCQYCQVMEEKTFRDNAVAAYLNDHYIPIQVDSDRQPKIAEQYRVEGLPATFFIASDGTSIGSQPGYIPPEVMLPLLRFIHTDSYRKMDFETFRERP
ncbi:MULTISPECIES: thioredoxin family protein [Desulfococcus]|uniref:Thioredoxin domain-containing protein n=1 Tax=Desulfococcus multivorans DSM 2059 TaxID=1121405 RepID=S7THF7_DESML|nr:DUF255 domain-containing protein [Desulfococcus multivorans]EPR36060.1 hypothetical protein dsmv_0765 [Desulfococcus multivorans DSM 2059]SJZ37764.1 Protein of unknown function, DUF255 [Desulfococcus multivorans DSM 2059]